MIRDTIYCPTCKKEIDIHENTTVKKNKNWDLYCTEDYTWLGSMYDLLGWSLDE